VTALKTPLEVNAGRSTSRGATFSRRSIRALHLLRPSLRHLPSIHEHSGGRAHEHRRSPFCSDLWPRTAWFDADTAFGYGAIASFVVALAIAVAVVVAGGPWPLGLCGIGSSSCSANRRSPLERGAQ